MGDILRPAKMLVAALLARLENEAEELDTSTRQRIEAFRQPGASVRSASDGLARHVGRARCRNTWRNLSTFLKLNGSVEGISTLVCTAIGGIR